MGPAFVGTVNLQDEVRNEEWNSKETEFCQIDLQNRWLFSSKSLW